MKFETILQNDIVAQYVFILNKLFPEISGGVVGVFAGADGVVVDLFIFTQRRTLPVAAE